MRTKVKVLGTDGNAIVVSKNNKEYGHIRLQQNRLMVDEITGFARPKPVYALMPGTVADLRLFGWAPGQDVDGCLFVKEQTEPFNEKDPDRDLKVAGETNIICMLGEKKIYRKVFYSTNPDAQDTLLEHTNTEEIKEAYEKLKAEKEKADLAQS